MSAECHVERGGRGSVSVCLAVQCMSSVERGGRGSVSVCLAVQCMSSACRPNAMLSGVEGEVCQYFLQ